MRMQVAEDIKAALDKAIQKLLLFNTPHTAQGEIVYHVGGVPCVIVDGDFILALYAEKTRELIGFMHKTSFTSLEDVGGGYVVPVFCVDFNDWEEVQCILT